VRDVIKGQSSLYPKLGGNAMYLSVDEVVGLLRVREELEGGEPPEEGAALVELGQLKEARV
jgi:hypothetical protein